MTSVLGQQQECAQRIRWWLVIALCLIFVIGLNLWVFWAELFTGASNIAGGNPPVPVLLMLTLLLPFRRWLTERELLAFYLFACFALIPTTFGGVRSFFPTLVVTRYYAMPDNRLMEFWRMLPDWWVTKDSALVREFFEGAEGRVPWDGWLFPLVRWTLFFMALWAIGCGLAWWLAPSWRTHERLNFPLAQLPLQMVKGWEGRPFFSSSLVWLGLLLGTVPTASMLVASFFRPVPRWWDIGQFLIDRPWNALKPLMIFPLMEGVGFGYLVPQDMLLSVWFFYAVLKGMALVGIGYLGWEAAFAPTIGLTESFPFPHAQSVGGYLAMAGLLLWQSIRRHPVGAWEGLWALGAGSLLVLAWMVLSGMTLTIAVLYWLVLALFVVTYARIRSEAGMPYSWVYPYGAQRDFLLYTFGAQGLLRMGGVRDLVILSGLFWVARHFYLNLNGAYGADSVKLAAEMGWSPAQMLLWCGFAALTGLWAAFLTHLKAYYTFGANFLEGAPGIADYRTFVAVQDFRSTLSSLLDKPTPPDRWRLGFTVYGAAVTVTLAWLRRHFPTFPLHPLGFPLAYAYSHHCPYWFPTFAIWAVKGAILQFGGMRLHRRLVPFFLGLTLGHYLMTGVVWGGILSPLLKGRLPFPLRIVFE